MTTGYYTILRDRSAIFVSGEDAAEFLQSLITQDMSLLETQNAIYAALLTPQGKMDYDFFIYNHDNGYLIETESARVEALSKRLKMFVLRRKVSLNIMEIQVVAAWGDDIDAEAFQLIHDPRKNIKLYRNFFMQAIDFENKGSLKLTESKFYHELCIHNAIVSGSADIAWGQDTAADIHLDELNGVSYGKGCYLGQELTSRMHHRNLGKQQLCHVKSDTLPPAFSNIEVEGQLIGQMRSSVGEHGLAILKRDRLDLAPLAGLDVLI